MSGIGAGPFLLALALSGTPLDQLLGRALDLVLAVPWLTLEKRGAKLHLKAKAKDSAGGPASGR